MSPRAAWRPAIVTAIGLTASALTGCAVSRTTQTLPTPSVEGSPSATALVPMWPPVDCGSIVGQAIDYVPGAEGSTSPEAAALKAVPYGAEVIRGPDPEPNRRRQWLVLDPNGSVIAAVEVFDGPGGWLADNVERCAVPAQ